MKRTTINVQNSEGLPLSDAVRFGDAATEIVEESEAAGADLIAVASHRRRGLDRARTRSVARRLRRATTIPLLIVSAGT